MKKKSKSDFESEAIWKYIENDNPSHMAKLTGGPFGEAKMICATTKCTKIMLTYKEDDISDIDFIAEYEQKGIHDLGVWEYEFVRSYRQDEYQDEYDDDNDNEGEEWKG